MVAGVHMFARFLATVDDLDKGALTKYVDDLDKNFNRSILMFVANYIAEKLVLTTGTVHMNFSNSSLIFYRTHVTVA